ncbi:MAG: YfhO family protein [Acidobacteriota bacterium]
MPSSERSDAPTSPARLRLPAGWWHPAAVAAFLIVAAWPLVVGERVPHWDAAAFYLPSQILVADHVAAGQIPLWNPWLQGGRPDSADVQVGGFSPVNLVVGAFPDRRTGFLAYWFFIWWLGGFGVWLLARHLRAPPWAGLAMAIATVSCGFYSGHAQHLSFVQAFSFLPIVIWRLDAALLASTRSARPLFATARAAAEAGAIFGLAALGGYPGMTISTALYVSAWTIGRLVLTRTDPLSHRARDLVFVAVIFSLFGCIVLSPAYVSFFAEGRGYSDRTETLSRERAVEENALDKRAVATTLAPGLTEIKKRDRRGIWQGTGASLSQNNLSLAALSLGLVALVWRRRSPWAWWLATVGLFFLAAALGRDLPVRGWLFDWVPPTRYFRHSGILRGFWMFTMVVLALEATRSLRFARRGAGWPLLAGTFASLGVAGHWLVPFGVPPGVIAAMPWRWEPLIFGGLFALLTAAGWWLARGRPRGARTAIPFLLVLLVAAEGVYALRISGWLLGSDAPSSRMRWQRLEENHVRSLDLTPRGLERGTVPDWVRDNTNQNLILKVPTLQGYDPFNNRLYLTWRADPNLIAIASGVDRFWFSPEAGIVEANRKRLARFARRVARDGAPPIVLHENDSPRDAELEMAALRERTRRQETILRELPTARRQPVEVLTYTPNLLRFAVTPEQDGWLLVTDRYAGGWRATIDGRDVPIHKAVFVFRAIEVQAGRQVVTMRYRPFLHPYLLVASWGTLLLVAGWAIVSRRHRVRRQATPPPASDRPATSMS